MDHGCTLVIMAKAPRPGAVKTRLSATLSPAEIVELYRCLLEDTLALARSLEGVETAIMCPPADVEALSHIAGPGVQIAAQPGMGLGAALEAVFAQFAHAGRRVVAFDSDSPHLPASILCDAFDALAGSDLVAGPTHDGGYYLVGASAAHAGLFSGDSLGTSNALEALKARARSLGLSVRFTGLSYDVDDGGDLERLQAELRLAPGRAPRTAQWLAGRARGGAEL